MWDSCSHGEQERNIDGCHRAVTGTNYGRNHSRSLASVNHVPGDSPVYVTCFICKSRIPADGVNGLRLSAERGVKAAMGYRGPSQVWVCARCASLYGCNLTKTQAELLVAGTKVHEPEPDSGDGTGDGTETESNFWKWALGTGVAVVIATGATLAARNRND